MQNQPHLYSWYATSVNRKLEQPPLEAARTTDACVVGAADTVLPTAIHLGELGYGVTVLEAN